MFIEPGAPKNGFAPAERNIPFVWTTPCAPPERWQCLLWISYKHLAALRPSPILSANFRVRTLAAAPFFGDRSLLVRDESFRDVVRGFDFIKSDSNSGPCVNAKFY